MVEIIEDAICDFRPSIMTMVLNEATQRGDFTRISDFAKFDHFHVNLGRESMRRIKDVRNSSTHTGSKVSPSGSKDHNSSSGHVLTSMVTGTFNNGIGNRVADSESFSSESTNERLARSSSIKTDVSDNDVLFCFEG